MKKSILLLAAIFSIGVMFTSCKETKKEEVKTESEDIHNHEGEEMASSDVYQCPMDCEKGKTYDAEGSCPVCKMDLKVNASEMEHTENCTCKAGGECTCEEGKCQCQAEIACTKCEPGKCTCKAEATACSKCEPGNCTCKAEAVTTSKEGSKCGSKCGSSSKCSSKA